jgi:hypothetical protein
VAFFVGLLSLDMMFPLGLGHCGWMQINHRQLVGCYRACCAFSRR